MQLTLMDFEQNLEDRIRRFPDPKAPVHAFYPVLEAISNAIHSTSTKFTSRNKDLGKITVRIRIDEDIKENVSVEVSDNGIGLNSSNWKSFVTADSAYKIVNGGKGVGRFLWIKCFKDITVHSAYEDIDKEYRERNFKFDYKLEGNLTGIKSKEVESFFSVAFKGFRNEKYLEHFPTKGGTIRDYIAGYFLPIFLSDNCPEITLLVNGMQFNFPEDALSIIIREESTFHENLEGIGQLNACLLECTKVSSAFWPGIHTIQLIANNQVVRVIPIGKKLGLGYYGANADMALHVPLGGEIFDKSVNQDRTDFRIEKGIIDRIVNEFLMPRIVEFLSEHLQKEKDHQISMAREVISLYPSVSISNLGNIFDDKPDLKKRADIYAELSREKFIREEKNRDLLSKLLSESSIASASSEGFNSKIKSAIAELELNKERSLGEYIVKRKLVLDFLEKLLESNESPNNNINYSSEEAIHSIFCPVRSSAMPQNSTNKPSHNFWIIDESFTFTENFTSDISLKSIDKNLSTERPDLIFFDELVGFRELSKNQVQIVEFKRPCRDKYGTHKADNSNPEVQIRSYIKQLKSSSFRDVKGRPAVKITDETFFECYLIADIVGHLDKLTEGWSFINNDPTKGRVLERIQNNTKGFIKLIPWDVLIENANMRNRAFFEALGINAKNLFES